MTNVKEKKERLVSFLGWGLYSNPSKIETGTYTETVRPKAGAGLLIKSGFGVKKGIFTYLLK